MQCIVYESALGQRVLVLIISHSYRPSTGLHRKFPCSYYVEPLLSAQENADPRSIIRDAKLMRVFQDKRTNQSIGIRGHDLLNDSISPCDQEEQTKRDQEAMESICLEVRSRRSANDFERPDIESLFKLVAVTGSSVSRHQAQLKSAHVDLLTSFCRAVPLYHSLWSCNQSQPGSATAMGAKHKLPVSAMR